MSILMTVCDAPKSNEAKNSQQTRVRKFRVDIVPSIIAHNIDTVVLREHYVH